MAEQVYIDDTGNVIPVKALANLAGLNSNGSWNLQNIGAGIQGLGSLASAFGNLYMGNKALNFAKDQFNFQKDLANTNLNNSIRSYNTKLGDIANTRSVMETGSTGKYDNWYNDNKLTR